MKRSYLNSGELILPEAVTFLNRFTNRDRNPLRNLSFSETKLDKIRKGATKRLVPSSQSYLTQ